MSEKAAATSTSFVGTEPAIKKLDSSSQQPQHFVLIPPYLGHDSLSLSFSSDYLVLYSLYFIYSSTDISHADLLTCHAAMPNTSYSSSNVHTTISMRMLSYITSPQLDTANFIVLPSYIHLVLVITHCHLWI